MILKLVDHAKTVYPIDAGRVYLTGYSMGGMSSSMVGLKNPSVFAAIGVMGANGPVLPGAGVDPTVAAAVAAEKDSIDLPFVVLRGALEAAPVGGSPAITGFADAAAPLLDINELPHGTSDYKAYPYWGLPTTNATVLTSKGLHFDVSYMYKGDKALGKFVIFEEGAHTHEDFYATLAWDFFSQFSR
jgi:pimeloyl-ACP methyl ester carboxylesterase